MFVRMIFMLFAFILFIQPTAAIVRAESISFHEEQVHFQSGDVMLNGTLFTPDQPGRHPAIVLVHGSSSNSREKYRQEAEMFAKAGLVTLIYDKRADGFSQSRVGGRSYSVLASDVLAAVAALGEDPAVDPAKIGLWGISEGGMVAALAASQSPQVSFLITVGLSGVQPAQQQSWHLENRLQHQGVTSPSMIRFASQNGIRFAVSAGLFPEATFDPMPVFEQLHQPVLAIWGSYDRIQPKVESAQQLEDALKRKGNEHYTIQFIPDASHLLRTSLDGFTQSEAFAPGYTEAMLAWLHEVVQGKPPGPQVKGERPGHDLPSNPGISRLSWYDSHWLQGGLFILLLGLFITGLIVTGKRNTSAQKSARLFPILFACTSLLTLLGMLGFFGFLMMTGAKDVAPILFGRPLPWLILQVLAVITSVLALLHARSWWRSRGTGADRLRADSSILLAAGLLFIPWALYWQLLLP
ncbi:alpha/beta hydrolase family protein [Brevibacillus migulae]|uniref:alpha/beta hydrolase family protein n=1 Tax=Brevibacillus migulae TaxID=1644114 RepID=UPI0014301258|nr:alpha/beta fold hydrolase [Brevibacillus migulae]